METHLNYQPNSHGIMAKDCNANDCSSTILEEEEEEEAAAAADSPSTVGPLQDMSSLLHQLPSNSKQGLSKHYKGKSQSFTSLAEVESLQDLAKPENPYNKRLKSAKSLPFHTNYLKLISKTSAGTYVVSERQPAVTQPRRTSSTSDFAKHQTPLFA